MIKFKNIARFGLALTLILTANSALADNTCTTDNEMSNLSDQQIQQKINHAKNQLEAAKDNERNSLEIAQDANGMSRLSQTMAVAASAPALVSEAGMTIFMTLAGEAGTTLTGIAFTGSIATAAVVVGHLTAFFGSAESKGAAESKELLRGLGTNPACDLKKLLVSLEDQRRITMTEMDIHNTIPSNLFGIEMKNLTIKLYAIAVSERVAQETYIAYLESKLAH